MMKERDRHLAIEQVPIDALRLDSANPRRITKAELHSLTRSVQEFGLVDPIIARREGATVIGSHQRLLAARRLGYATVPVIFVELTMEQAKLLNLALNRITDDWDQDLLARLLSELGSVPDIDLTLSGFEEDEIKNLLRSLDVRERRDRPETFDLDAALEAARADPGVEGGEVWQLGDHRIMCGDATDTGNVERLVDTGQASVAFTDPPYNVSYGDHGGQQRGSRKRQVRNDSLSPEEWEAFCRAWAKNLLTRIEGALYICMSTKEWPVVSRILDELGGHWSDTIIWAKDRFTLGRADYQRQYEPIWYGWRDGAKHHWCGDRDQGDVWTIPRPAESELHPTMKPLALVERAIENSSQQGDVVLDLFLGSGTTLIAAERTGRVCYGLELDPHYCRIAIARWESFSGGNAERVR